MVLGGSTKAVVAWIIVSIITSFSTNIYIGGAVRYLAQTLKLGVSGRPRGTVGKAPASEARGSGLEPPWLVQRSRWKSRPLSLVGNGAGAVTHPTDRKGSVFPRGTGRFLIKRVS